MQEQEVSNCISGLGRLGAEWTDLTPAIRRSLGDAFVLIARAGSLPPRGLAMSIHGLGRMNADFTSLPSNFQTSIMAAIYKISPRVNSLEVSNMLYGLGKMGTSFTIDEVNMSKEAAASTVITGSTSSLPFAIPGLAMKGVSSEELDLSIAGRVKGTNPLLKGSPGRGFKADCEMAVGMSRKARESLLDAFRREALQMNNQGISNSLWGLMLMDAHWWILNPSLQSIVFEVMQREAERMTEQELCNSIYALGRLGVRWSDLPVETKTSILLAVEGTSTVMAPAGVVMTLLGLGRMSLTWGDMSLSLLSALSSATERVLQTASERTLSGLVHALATVGARWGDLSPALQRAILNGISKGEAANQEKQIADSLSSANDAVSNKISSTPPISSKSGRSPERASRAAFGASAILTIKTIRNTSTSPLTPKTPSAQASLWPQSKLTPLTSKSLSTSSLLNQKSSRAAAALLLSPSSPLGPTALVAIQTMISPPNLDMHSFKALIQSQLASPVVEPEQSPQVQAPKRLPSQPVAANELEFYKSVAATPKNAQGVEKSSKARNGSGSGSGILKPSKKTPTQKETWEMKKVDPSTKGPKGKKSSVAKTGESSNSKIRSNTMSNAVPLPTVSVPIVPPVAGSSSGSGSGGAGNHLVYSLGQMGASWNELGGETRSTLSDSLVQSLPQMNEMGVVNSLHGLTSLGARWSELRADVQSAFQEAIEKVSPEMGEQGVSVAILSLAKLDVVWMEDLSESVRKSLKSATARQSHIGEHALSSLLYGLGKLSRTWCGLAYEVRQTLKEAIVLCHLNDRCTPQGVANSLHGLAQMQATWAVLSSSVRLALFAEVTKAVPLATETQLSNIVGSLGKMGLQWEALPDQLNCRVVAALTTKAETFNEWHLSTLLFSLGSMGLSWKNLPTSLRNAFISALLRVNSVDQSSGREKLSSGNDQKGQNSWKPKSVDLEDYDELLTVVDYIIRKEDENIPKRISSDNEAKSRAKATAEQEKALQLNAQGVSMTIVGMSRLAASYGLLPDTVVESLSNSLQKACPSMNCAQIAASVSGLSKAQWRWDALGAALKEELLAAITRTSPKATSLDMAILMNGLGSMGARWSDLPGHTRTSLQVGIKRTAMTGAADEVAGVTFGLALMEVSWNVLPSNTKRSLKDGILRVCYANVEGSYTSPTVETTAPPQDIAVTNAIRFASTSKPRMSSAGSRSFSSSNSVTGKVEELELSWLMAPPDNRVRARAPSQVEKKQVQPMSPQALANLMYAVSLLIFEESTEVHEELTPVHIALLDSISLIGVGSSHFSEAEKEQILIYISTLQTLTPLGQTVTDRPKCALRADKPFVKPSKLQQGVVSALTTALRRKNADFEVEDEYSAFSGAFPVDATIFEGDKPVAFVEVNGPQHYREDGRLRRKDLMKEALYRGKYPDASFTRVRFDQINRLGPTYVGAQVAQFISNSPPVRVRCTAAAGVGSSFFPLYSSSSSPDVCSVVYQNCEEDGLAVRRAQRELAKALSLEGSQDMNAWSPIINNVHSHAFYLSQSII
jgi:hypothetical protein